MTRAPHLLFTRLALVCAVVALSQLPTPAAAYGVAAAPDPGADAPPTVVVSKPAAPPVARGERCAETFRVEDLAYRSSEQAAAAADELADALKSRPAGNGGAAVECRCLQAIAAAVAKAKPESAARVRQSFAVRAPDCTHQIITTLERALGGEPSREGRASPPPGSRPRGAAQRLCRTAMDCMFLEPRPAVVADRPQLWWEKE